MMDVNYWEISSCCTRSVLLWHDIHRRYCKGKTIPLRSWTGPEGYRRL